MYLNSNSLVHLFPLLISLIFLQNVTLVQATDELPSPQVALLCLKSDINFRTTSDSAILSIGDPFNRSQDLELFLHPLNDDEWKSNFLSVTHYLVTNTEKLGLFKVHFESVLAERSPDQRHHASRYHPGKTYHDLIMNYTTVYISEINSSVLLITQLGNYLEVYGLINDRIEITPLWRRNPKRTIQPGILLPSDMNEHFIYNRSLLHRIVDRGSQESNDFRSGELIEKIKNIHSKRNEAIMKSALNNHPILDEFPIIRPEVSIFIDSFEYDNLGQNIDAVWRYSVMFFTRLSLIFKQLPDPTIELQLKNILVATRPFRFQKIIPDFRSFTPQPYHSYLNALKALKEFGTVFNIEEPILENSDMILVISGQDLCLDSNANWINSCSYSTIRGQAFVGGACQKNIYRTQKMNVAIIEDSGHFDGVHAAAHELGHLLGAVHDGQWPLSTILGPGGRGCTSSAGNLMSSGQKDSVFTSDKRRFELSICSQEQIQYFSQLPRAMCLYGRPVK